MRLHFQAWTLALAGSLVAGKLSAQTITVTPSVGPNQNRVIPLHPLSPIEYFRELLSMKPQERERALADKLPEQRRKILFKIREYELMPADERELRLRQTELRWYLARLMPMQPVERLSQLSKIPAEKRGLIEERLQKWDQVPLPLQKELLDNEAMIRRVMEWEITPKQDRANISLDDRQKIEGELTKWRSLPTAQRQRMVENFRQFFDLNNEQKRKILSTLTDGERQQMEKTLKNFENLPPQMRQKCISSFSQLVGMSSEERTEFLKNAERWQAMTPSERQAWRELVNKLPPLPPAPPGTMRPTSGSPPSLPPLPSRVEKRPTSSSPQLQATNSE